MIECKTVEDVAIEFVHGRHAVAWTKRLLSAPSESPHKYLSLMLHTTTIAERSPGGSVVLLLEDRLTQTTSVARNVVRRVLEANGYERQHNTLTLTITYEGQKIPAQFAVYER